METAATSSLNELSHPAANAGFWQGVKDCVPTLLGYLSIGFACGVVGRTAGLSTAEIVLLSTFLYAGSAQFIVAGMIAAGGTMYSIIVTVLFVNIRHLLLSAAISPYFRSFPWWKNVLLGSQLTDETFGVAVNRLSNDWKHRDKWMFGLNITAHINWIAATFAGAYFGAWIPDPEAYGLSFALPAMFIGLLVLQMAHRKQIRTDLAVAGGAVVLFLAAFTVMSANLAVLTAIIGAACIGMVIEHGNQT
ncbi:branched-chain amino acid ABC transporter permease [Paenibacillus sambharensis]|uniref:Branched-chain amino acid ABC transporter permease n=1 Tax=Paenibacillus sambharensis TaxID=1803190 RepID=A0A2W1LDM3_9BACL|nr:AzlC family ABC transporter permease [Paenibacillus sambharensis]PZD96170.1 branched-chain amino acid ABC transporter permease [Paenibacillus sambharensis]